MWPTWKGLIFPVIWFWNPWHTGYSQRNLCGCAIKTSQLRPLTFRFGSGHAYTSHMINPSTNLEDSAPIPSWFISYDISHRVPLTLHLQQLCMLHNHITWPTSRRGQICLLDKVVHALKRNILSYLDKILQSDMYPGLNHLCKTAFL